LFHNYTAVEQNEIGIRSKRQTLAELWAWRGEPPGQAIGIQNLPKANTDEPSQEADAD
jgi:hypothetical protein